MGTGASGTDSDLVSGRNNDSNDITILTGCGHESRDFSSINYEILSVRGAESTGDNGDTGLEDSDASLPKHNLDAIFGRGYLTGVPDTGSLATGGSGAGVIGQGGNYQSAYGPGVIGLTRNFDRNKLININTIGIGVVGAGQAYGVCGMGNSDSYAGQNNRTVGAGVLGNGLRNGVGVVGLNFHYDDIYGDLGDSFGVIGASSAGVGVLGLSIPSVEQVMPNFDPNKVGYGSGIGIKGASGEGTGVEGTANDKKGVGVKGTAIGGSDDSIGVKGTSKYGRGGWFESEIIAQLHLEPHPLPPEGDPNGLIKGLGGDLIATKDGEGTSHLWFCRRDGSKTDWYHLTP